MIAALASVVLIHQDLPKSFEDLISRMTKAYHALENYADTWDLTDEAQEGAGLRFRRRIDGKRSWLRASTFQGSKEDPLFEECANGNEIFVIVYPAKSYSLGKDDGSFLLSDPMHVDKGSFSMGVSNYEMLIQCKPAPTLTSIKSVPGQVGGGRVAIAEAYNPDTKNRLTIQMSFLNRWWLLSDVSATVHFANGTDQHLKMHPSTLMMNAKLPAKGFEIDHSMIKGFTKKSRESVLKDLQALGKG